MAKITQRNGYIRHSDDVTRSREDHIRVAEKKLGRKIGRSEHVHHVDEDPANNDPNNLMVLRSQNDHALIHSGRPYELFQTKDGSFVAVPEQKSCSYCGRPFVANKHYQQYDTVGCGVHGTIDTRIESIKQSLDTIKTHVIPSAEELRELVWSKPTTAIAEELGVSDTAVAKWCKKFEIEKPGRGYWRSIVADKA